MTGYHIQIGYNAQGGHPDDLWGDLVKTVRFVCSHPERIIAEARRLGAPEKCERGCCTLATHAAVYADPIGQDGHPVKFIDRPGEPQNRQVMQLAAAADPIKYHIRRAFIRLLIAEMHKQEIEVNLTVA